MKTTKNPPSWQTLANDTYLSAGADDYLDNLYEAYLKSPSSVAPEWQQYFASIADGAADIAHGDIKEYFAKLARMPNTIVTASPAKVNVQYQRQQEKVMDLINAYRMWGHLQANIDPLGLYQGIANPALDLSYYGFTDADLATEFDVGTFKGIKQSVASLRAIHQALQQTYSHTLGIEYMHIMRQEEVAWIQQRIEQDWTNYRPSKEQKLRILDRLVVADGLEKYLGSKYVGQKRFSIEGGDSLIPMLDVIINSSVAQGTKEIVIGMAHRGRLNVLVNVLGKDPKAIFAGFEGRGFDETISGDVKYHIGFSSNIETVNGPLHAGIAFNPSHLEIVSPVVQGSVRSRQRRRKDTDRVQTIPIQIHGDAAFSGQGVVMETFNMSQARWFQIGGSLHIVINNQIGFTISDPRDARSGFYCTDIAKMVQAPILHVNGNDPEAVCFAAQLAIDYRMHFKKDVVIDLMCYRRHGHNEADEPSATQPTMYNVIKTLPTPAAIYAKKLVGEGVIDEQYEQQLALAYRDKLDKGETVVPLVKDAGFYEYTDIWKKYLGQSWQAPAKTAVPLKKLQTLAHALEQLPKDFKVQTQVKKTLEARIKMTEGELSLNWGYAEVLAYATLLDEGYPIRLCGQDAGRGTFAHRHSVLYDQVTGAIYVPLSHIAQNQVHINIVDSLLSEEAVMAFEYGFAAADPNSLVIWEAQFGDFANGAQVVIDQFISGSEQKWGRLCGLVLLLPHGYEGAGPEHSSARLERYLQLCAQDNMQVCVPTTPAQIFHLLRRQMVRPYRKPLIVMTPKSLLRHPLATSSLTDLSEGEFQLIIPEVDKISPANVRRVIICCGKVYYDLLEARREQKLENIAILRLEQLYPFPAEAVAKALAPYQATTDIVWCQEEPKNQGAWFKVKEDIQSLLTQQQCLSYVGRSEAASTAAGHAVTHEKEQEQLVKEALSL